MIKADRYLPHADPVPRLVGVATAIYGAAITISPRLLAGPVGLLDADGSVPPVVANMIRSIGVRDAALATALVLAPAGSPLRTLTVARVVCDAADAVWFGRMADTRAATLKVSAIASTWAVLEALAGFAGPGVRGQLLRRFQRESKH